MIQQLNISEKLFPSVLKDQNASQKQLLATPNEQKITSPILIPDNFHSVSDWKEKEEQIQTLKGQLQMLKEQKFEEQNKSSRSTPIPPFTKSQKVHRLVPSSVWCHGPRKRRICNFKNLYFNSELDDWFFVKGPTSVIQGLDGVDLRNVLDMTSLEEHNAFFFQYTEVQEDKFTNVEVEKVQARTFVLSRFHTGNIMHAIHDDLIGLYHLHKEFSPAPSSQIHPLESFRRDNFLFFCDGHEEGGYGHVFKYLTDYPLQFKVQHSKKPGKLLWFPDAIVGNSKIANWYQYGFLIPQGPIADKKVSGAHVREVSDYISHRLNLAEWDFGEVKQVIRNFIANFTSTPDNPDSLISKDYCISIFSRRHDRLIVNELELAAFLQRRFRLEVKFVRNEDLTFAQQIPILRKTILAIGMHGSLLVMGMFLPPGALMIEMYPFAVPSANYTPYNSMCKLPGMNLAYESWTNTHAASNTSFPDRVAHYGGISHLPTDEQQKIVNTHTVPEHLCCTNPFWLFRIFQDTRVNLPEIEQKVIQGFQGSLDLIQKAIDNKAQITPATITQAVCKFDRQGRTVTLSWEMPWNGTVQGSGMYFSIWSHVHYREFQTEETSIVIKDCDPAQAHGFWVKPGVRGGVQGSFSKKIVCE